MILSHSHSFLPLAVIRSSDKKTGVHSKSLFIQLYLMAFWHPCFHGCCWPWLPFPSYFFLFSLINFLPLLSLSGVSKSCIFAVVLHFPHFFQVLSYASESVPHRVFGFPRFLFSSTIWVSDLFVSVSYLIFST